MADLVRRRERPEALMTWPFRRFFEDFFQSFEDEFGLPELWTQSRFIPPMNVSEDEDGVTITAELPGLAKEDLEVSVENGVLTLRGEKKEEKTTKEANYHRLERRYGRFERRIRLPDYVDADKVDATYRDGVLTLRMPKVEAAKPKTIQIK